jgi:hypothetical protein
MRQSLRPSAARDVVSRGRSPAPDKTETKEDRSRVEEFAAVIAAIAQIGSATLVVVAFARTYFYSAPYLVLAGGGLAALSVCWWPWLRRSRKAATPSAWRLRIRLTVLVILVTAVAIGWIYYLTRPRPGKGPVGRDVSDRRWSFGAAVVHAASQPQDTGSRTTTKAAANPVAATEVRWALVSSRSSLTSRVQDGRLHIYPDPDIRADLQSRAARPQDGAAMQGAILRWIEKRIEVTTPSVAARILLARHRTNLTALTADHPDIVASLLPTQAEYRAMPAAEQDIVAHWITHHVGQWRPRIRLTIDNTRGEAPLQVIAVTYNVKAVGQFRSGETDAEPQPEVHFELACVNGPQTYQLGSSGREITVLAHGVSGFDLVLGARRDCPATPTWSGSLELVTNRGTIPVGELALDLFNAYRPNQIPPMKPTP